MKKNILFFCLISINISLNSLVTNPVCFDDSGSLASKEIQIGGFTTIITTPLLISTNFALNQTKIYNYRELYLFVPVINLGISGRFGLEKNIEIGFTNIFSGPAHKEQFGTLYIFGIYEDFTFKKSIKIKNNFFFAYKINLGINFILIDLGIDIILKNSFLLGIVEKKISFNFVPSIKNSIFAGRSVFYGNFTYFSVTPEILVNFHLFTKNKIVFAFEWFILNEFLFHRSSAWDRSIYGIDVDYLDNFDSGLSFGFSFGLFFSNR